MHIVLQTVLEVVDDGVVNVVACRSTFPREGDEVTVDASSDATVTDDEAMRVFPTGTRSKWPRVSSPPPRRSCPDWAEWPGSFLLLHLGFGGFNRGLDLSRRE